MIAPNLTLDNQTILVTGAAGFIGANLARGLIETEKGVTVIGFDNVNDYYDVKIKESRLREIEKTAAAHPANRWIFIRGDLADAAAVDALSGNTARAWSSIWRRRRASATRSTTPTSTFRAT